MIDYRTGLAGISAQDLDGFFEGWPAAPSAAALLRILAASTHRVLAVEDGAVVGFVTALSDGELAAYLPLLEVRASHRERGIGSELVRRVLELVGDVYMTDLVCDPDLVPFYERLGLQPLAGMARRNRTAAVLST